MHRIEGSNVAKDSNSNNIFTDGPPATTLPAAWLNAIQEEIAKVIEAAGLNLNAQSNDTKDQLLSAIRLLSPNEGYDEVVSTQTEFNNIIERVAANQYKISDSVKSVYFENISSTGFLMYGGTSPLSDGDTWGYIQTNNCTLIVAEGGVPINFGTTQGYLNVNTDYCALHNVHIKGDTGSASAISYGILVSNSYVSLYGCRVSNRNSSASFVGISGANNDAKDKTNTYVNCKVDTIVGSTTAYGMRYCNNISNALISGFDFSAGQIIGMSNCNNIVNTRIENFDTDSGVANGFNSCYYMSNCYVETIDGSSTTTGFNGCYYLSSCYVKTITSGAAEAYGYAGCSVISSCYAEAITATAVSAFGYSTCSRMSACDAFTITGDAFASGFSSCTYISASTCSAVSANTLDAYGFTNCDYLSACYTTTVSSTSGASFGYYGCDYISACYAISITAPSGTPKGFASCSHGSSLGTNVASNTSNSLMDSPSAALAVKYSISDIFT